LAFAPFDGVLLDDPRDPIPGVVAIQLHVQVDRLLAARERRPARKAAAIQERAAACQALLGQGLLPAQVRELERFGLDLGNPLNPLSLASLVRHLEAYLELVEGSGYLEPSAALWQGAVRQANGERGFWVERHPEEGPLEAGIRDLAPPRLRALCALPELGSVRFRLATRRGAGRAGLFEGTEPHLVRLLLPTLESLAAERGLEHLELDQPEGWAENPWGGALDHLFAGPLRLDDGGRAALRRRELPTEAAVWRAALEQARTWVEAGIPPSEITLVHPDAPRLGPLLGPLFAAEGLPFQGGSGPSLAEARTWGPLWSLLTGLRDADPASLVAGLGASVHATALGRALRALADRLDRTDQAGEAALDQAFEALPEGDRAWLKERWVFLRDLPTRTQAPLLWLRDLEALAQRLDLMHGPTFYPAFGLLQEAWSRDSTPLPFGAFLEALACALEAMRAPDPPSPHEGVRLVGPEALESTWNGARATLLLDLSEGVWPPTPTQNAELDWPRRVAINTALRAQSASGGGARDFPPHLQAFPLPLSEEGEVLPRAFHRAAFAFNRVLALTRESLVALSAERDAEGRRRSQGPFWSALEGAGTWEPSPTEAASDLRWRWDSPRVDDLALARQGAMKTLEAPLLDQVPGLWRHGQSAETPLSPTRLEGLARCPFRVFAERHLRLPSWEAGDRHPLNLGSLAHRLMEDLLGGLEDQPHWPPAFLERHGLAAPTSAELLALLKTRWQLQASAWIAELKDVSASEIQRLRLALEDLLPPMAELLAGDLAEGGPTEAEIEALHLPTEGRWQRQLLGLEYALAPREVALPEGDSCWIQGTIDRLERLSCGDTQFLRIVDYKSSTRATLKAYQEDEGAFGAHLQLPLYQAMLEAETGLPATALLVSLKEGWNPLPMMLHGEHQVRLLANVGGLLARAHRGSFPALPGEHCATCGLASLCARPVDIDTPAEGEEAP